MSHCLVTSRVEGPGIGPLVRAGPQVSSGALSRIRKALNVGKTVGGHYASSDKGIAFSAYVAGGAADDHEGTAEADAIARVRLGMKSMMRLGSAWYDVESQITAITETGVRTTENDYEFDIIVLATGFRAYTGALEAFPIRGQSGQSLSEKWETTSNCLMGVCAADFPNLFMVTGPQAPFANLPTSIEQNAIWISDCIKKMESEGYDTFTPKQEAEDEWSAHVSEVHKQTLMNQGDSVHSWMMGANIENHPARVLIYFGGANAYYDKLRESVDAGFPELEFERLAS